MVNRQAKRRPDKFSTLAKQQGFRSRAAYKLLQLNRQFDILGTARVVLDLCAAPGGWLQVAAKSCPQSSIIVGVDLVPIKPIKNVITLTEDITTASCRSAIKQHLKDWKADVVLHDGAPNMGMAWVQDAYTQSELVLKALTLAVDFLRPGGTFLTKVFRSQDYNSLIYVMKKLFKKVTATKPVSSRNTSAEIFVCCQGYLDAELDRRMLDPRYVFKQVEEEGRKPDIFRSKQKRNREGYADDANMSLFRTLPAITFVEEEDTLSKLAAYNQLTFDDERSALLRRHPVTTAEILTCCRDLKTLGRGDMKHLLKWRRALREQFLRIQTDDTTATDTTTATTSQVATVEDLEEKMEREMEELAQELDRRDHRSARKLRKKLAKQRERMALGIDTQGEKETADDDPLLFRLDMLQGKSLSDKALQADPLEGVPVLGEAGPRRVNAVSKRAIIDMVPTEEFDDYLENQLDDLYDMVMKRRRSRAGQVDLPDFSAALKPNLDYNPDIGGLSSDEEEEQDEEEEEEDSEEEFKKSSNRRTSGVPLNQQNQWFSQDVFKWVEGAAADAKPLVAQPVNASARRALQSAKAISEAAGGESEDWRTTNEIREANRLSGVGSTLGGARFDSAKDGFEVVAVKDSKAVKAARRREEAVARGGALDEEDLDTDSSSSYVSSEEEENEEEEEQDKRMKKMKKEEKEESESKVLKPEANLDDQVMTLAMAKKLLTKQGRRELEDFGYNRYAYNDDPADLPKWFVDDESRHNRPQMPITKEDVIEARKRFRELDAKPIKKVAEAKGRKRRQAATRVKKAREKAEAIAQSSELSERAKLKQIKDLYKKAGSKRIAPVTIVRKKYQMSSKAAKNRPGTRVKFVDTRMKKDRYAQDRATAIKRKGTAAKKNLRKRK